MSPVPANNREIKKEDDDDDDINASDAPQFVLHNSDSDSDTGELEVDGYQGYQLLPQDPDGIIDEEQDVITGPPQPLPPMTAPQPPSAVDTAIMQSLDQHDMLNAVAPQSGAVEEVTPSERTEMWNSTPAASASSIPMDEDHVAKIRSAMSGFTLPLSTLPPWVGQLSDDDWTALIQQQGTVNAAGPSTKPDKSTQNSQNGSGNDKTVDR